MKQYTQYIHKDDEWRILGATNSSPFSKLIGTQANPIYLTSLESGQYLIQGYIKIDATHDFAIPVNCPYDTNCIIGYELFTICKNTDVGTMSVSCNYGNFLYDITGDNPVLLEAQMYASVDDIPTKTSDLTNDSGFITSDSDEKVKQIANTTSNSALRVLFAPNVLDTDYTGNVNKNSNFTYNPSTKALVTGGTVDGYKLAAASAKGIDTSITTASTSANLPTSQAVASFVEGKGYTSNTGTITGVSVNGTSVATSGVANITAATGVKGDSEQSYRTGNVNITKANLGLGNVENKSSATIRGELTSSNVTTALGYTPINSNLKGANNGLAELDANGKVPSSQLPSYVDDVLEYTSQSAFPTTGETGKIYIAQDTNKTYRWSGTAYTEISASLALGETSSTAYRGDRGKIAYDHSQSTHARTDATATAASTTNGNIKINGTETTVYTHPNSGISAGTYKSVTVDTNGHVTGGSNPTTLSGYGVTDAKIASGVITLGSNTITPLTSSSTLDATKVSGTLPISTYTNTKNTAGSTDSSSKLFLVGATSQAANPQTYSQDTAYVGTDGHLYSNSKQVVNLSDSQALTNKTYNGYTLNAASAKAVDTSISEGTSSTNLPTSAAVANYAPIKIKTGTNGAATITNKIDMKSDAYNGVEFLTRADKDANNFSYSGISSASNDEQTSENSLYSYIKKGSATKSATISTYVSDNGTSLDNSEIRLGADDIYAAAGNNLNISATSLNIGDQYNNTSLNSYIYGDNYGDLGQHGDLQVEGDFGAYATNTSTGDANTISHGQGNISLTAANQSNSTASSLSLNPNGTASLSANSLTISGVVTPTNNTDAVNKQYVDNAISSITPTIPNATSTTVGGIKMRLDIDTNTLYITNDGSNA